MLVFIIKLLTSVVFKSCYYIAPMNITFEIILFISNFHIFHVQFQSYHFYASHTLRVYFPLVRKFHAVQVNSTPVLENCTEMFALCVHLYIWD